jgi:hypothetical protein
MQELSVLVTKRDIQKAMNAMLPAKKHKTVRGETSRIQPTTLYLHDHDVSDTEDPPSVYGEDTFGDNTAQEDPVVQEDGMKYIIGDNGLQIGWLT